MRSRFYHPVILIILCLSFAFIGCGGSGGGSSGGGGDAPAAETFNTVDFFPLTSSWQTDKWTLFVDMFKHDVNGILTKALVDTRGPFAHYWTCDDNGLILHGEIDEDGLIYLPSEPVVFMHSKGKIGDKQEGTYTMYGVQVNYVVEIMGKEDVSVPAGYFANCLKIDVLVYPADELPSQYGHETFWLAKGVGFVKGQSDQNTLSELFTDSGETRELLSYHITPSDLSAEEQALREAYMNLNQYWKDGDMGMIAQMIHTQYQDERCRDKNTVLTDWENFHNNNDLVADLMTPEDVQINNDEAVVIREELFGYVPIAGGDINWDWSRVLRKWKKEGGEWKYYGAHTDNFRPENQAVWSRNETDPGERNVIYADFFKCGVDEWIDTPPDVIQSLTVTGPPGSGITDLDLKPCWFGELYPTTDRYFWCPDELQNAVSGFYTFRVEDLDGDYFVFTDYLEATPQLAVPVHVSPVDGAVDVPVSVTLNWDPVELTEGYRVDMRYSTDGGNTWIGMPNQYPPNPTDTQVTIDLDPGTEYQWRVRARRFDVYGELDTDSRSNWTWFKTSDPPPAQIINPGFEQGETGWFKGQTSGTDCTFTIDTDAYEGSQAAKLTINNGGYCMLGNETLIPINETRSYTLSGYAKVSGGGVDHLSIAVWKSQDSGPETSAGFTNPNTFSGDYQLFELTVDLEAGDDIRLELGIDNTSGTGSVLYDSLSLD